MLIYLFIYSSQEAHDVTYLFILFRRSGRHLFVSFSFFIFLVRGGYLFIYSSAVGPAGAYLFIHFSRRTHLKTLIHSFFSGGQAETYFFIFPYSIFLVRGGYSFIDSFAGGFCTTFFHFFISCRLLLI